MHHITNNIHKFDVFVRKCVRLCVDEITSLFIKVVGDLLCPFWRLPQNTQNLTLITLALDIVVRRKEEPVTNSFNEGGGNSFRHDYSPFA